MNIGIVLAGGVGNRFGSKTPKQYQLINGKEVISYSISALKNSKSIDKVIIVAKDEFISKVAEDYNVEVVEGGDTRNGSLFRGLNYIHNNYDCKKVIILEAARPMITTEIIDEYIEKLDEYDAAITGQKITDSLGCYNQKTVDRSQYYLIQAPEAFRFKILYENFDENSSITATNQQLPESAKTYINFNFINNLKITYFQDLRYCEMQMGY